MESHFKMIGKYSVHVLNINTDIFFLIFSGRLPRMYSRLQGMYGRMPGMHGRLPGMYGRLPGMYIPGPEMYQLLPYMKN